VDDVDENKPVWPTWAVGFKGARYMHINLAGFRTGMHCRNFERMKEEKQATAYGVIARIELKGVLWRP
jgi:hypothetical protein